MRWRTFCPPFTICSCQSWHSVGDSIFPFPLYIIVFWTWLLCSRNLALQGGVEFSSAETRQHNSNSNLNLFVFLSKQYLKRCGLQDQTCEALFCIYTSSSVYFTTYIITPSSLKYKNDVYRRQRSLGYM